MVLAEVHTISNQDSENFTYVQGKQLVVTKRVSLKVGFLPWPSPFQSCYKLYADFSLPTGAIWTFGPSLSSLFIAHSSSDTSILLLQHPPPSLHQSFLLYIFVSLSKPLFSNYELSQSWFNFQNLNLSPNSAIYYLQKSYTTVKKKKKECYITFLELSRLLWNEG